MPKNRKSLKKQRTQAFNMQKGLCYYCNFPMAIGNPKEFAARRKIARKHAVHFQCTAEHLKAFSEGGGSAQDNIVAACRFCNLRRHRKKEALDPMEYKKYVQTLIEQKKWGTSLLFSR
jgi:5-methylcytosine-specific restriction endonuclease McrA